jgi:hypothetical protein
MNDARFEAKLSELRERTSLLRARPGFQARVLLAVAREAKSAFSVELWRSARWFVPVALAAAVISLGWAGFERPVSSAALASADLAWELETW